MLDKDKPLTWSAGHLNTSWTHYSQGGRRREECEASRSSVSWGQIVLVNHKGFVRLETRISLKYCQCYSNFSYSQCGIDVLTFIRVCFARYKGLPLRSSYDLYTSSNKAPPSIHLMIQHSLWDSSLPFLSWWLPEPYEPRPSAIIAPTNSRTQSKEVQAATTWARPASPVTM